MMGFTQSEVDSYVDSIFAEHDWPAVLKQRVLEDLLAHYNGYRLLPEATETLYNSTICNFYLNKLVISNGKTPRELIDDNLRVDINWLRRLTGGKEPARKLVAQVGRYTDDLRRAHPELAINSYVAYTVGSAGGRLLKV